MPVLVGHAAVLRADLALADHRREDLDYARPLRTDRANGVPAFGTAESVSAVTRITVPSDTRG